MTTYLNTASCGLIEEDVISANVNFTKQFVINGSKANMDWAQEYYWPIKEQLATLFNCSKNNIAFLPNMSYGLNMIIPSLQGNEKVLLYKNDFPSLNLPFEHNKFDITYINDIDGFEISIAIIEEIFQSQPIDILAISHVQYISGFKIDIQSLSVLCKKYNVWLIIDGTQSLGAMALNFAKDAPDVYIASNYKWMNAGYGTGILYMNDAFLAHYPPTITGNHSIGLLIDNPKAKINAFEPGHLNTHGLTMMHHALAKKLECGIEKIETHNMNLSLKLINYLKGVSVKLIGGYDLKDRSSIISIHNEENLFELLVNNNIIVTNRFGILRISIHYYNTSEHIEKFISVIKKWKNE